MSDSSGRIVQATDNACKILAALQLLEGAGVTELAEELEYAPSTVHAQLNTLAENGLVVKSGDQYQLSFKFLDIAQHVVTRFGNFDEIRSEVDSLAAETSEVVQFATREQGKLVYLYKASGDNAVKTGSFRGKREYLHSTAAGLAILSTMSETEVQDIIDEHGLPEQTDRTITTREALFESLDRIRERGYAVDDEENALGLRSLAMPVMVSPELNLGAVSVTGPASRMTEDRFESQLLDAVSSSVNIVEVNYKFSQ